MQLFNSFLDGMGRRLSGGCFCGRHHYSDPRLGAALTFSLLVAGQLLMGVLMDHFGTLGIQTQPMSWMRMTGIGLIIAGVVLIRKF